MEPVNRVEQLIRATNGRHDFGVRKDTKLAASWTELCVKWLVNYGFLPAK